MGIGPKEYSIRLEGEGIAEKTTYNEQKIKDSGVCILGNPENQVTLKADKGEQITIGRSSDRDIVIDNQYISRDHGVLSEEFYKHRGKNDASVDGETVEAGDMKRFSEGVSEIELVEDMDVKAYVSQH